MPLREKGVRVLYGRFFLVGWMLFTLSACSSPASYYTIPEQRFPLPADRELEILLDDLQLELAGHSQDQLFIGGTSTSRDVKLWVTEVEGGLVAQITSESSLSGSTVRINIPAGRSVRIVQPSGSIRVRDMTGELSVESRSASIAIEGFEGTARVVSRRGSIWIRDSEGLIDAIAEAEEIHFQTAHGQISGTNIMGEINFEGTINTDDDIRLETDHGSVDVRIERESSMDIELSSAGGRITCSLPGMSGLMDQCAGRYGEGGGRLWIRSVGGPIRIDLSP